MTDVVPRKRFNIYYIFLEDKINHPPPPQAVSKWKETLSQHIANTKK